jgi:hypothetical protein
MSLRPRPVVARVASFTRLQNVLQAGLNVQAHTESANPYITVNGIQISTDPNQWSPLTAKQMSKLLLNPEDMKEFERKGNASRNDPNAAYNPNAACKGTKFLSDVEDQYYKRYVYWVVDLGYVRSTEPAYMVLARPIEDENVYLRSNPMR